MSKKSDTLGIVVKVVFLVLMGLVALSITLLFLVFFVPIAGWFIWSAYDKASELEKRVAALEKPKDQKPDSG